MTFRHTENSFDLLPERDPREIVCLESVQVNYILYERGVLHRVFLQTVGWGYVWFDAGKVTSLTLSTSSSYVLKLKMEKAFLEKYSAIDLT